VEYGVVPDVVASPKRAVSDYLHDTVFGAYAYSHLHLWRFCFPLYTLPAVLLSLPVLYLTPLRI